MTILDALPVSAPLLGGFAAVALAIVVSPGPDTLLILRHTLTSGRGVGLATVTGVQLGVALHTTAAALGLSLLIAGSPLLFQAVALAGAAYLGWLGIEAWKSGALDFAQGNGNRVSPRRGLADAVMTNLLNPKVIVLFLALMPGFVEPAKGNAGLQMVLLGGVLVGINTLWQVGLVLMAGWARGHLLKPLWQKAINRASGGVFLIFAALMLFEHWLGSFSNG